MVACPTHAARRLRKVRGCAYEKTSSLTFLHIRIQILEDWLRAKFTTDDWSGIEEMFRTLRHVRSLRQKPAHAIRENEFDQRYVHEQRELMRSVYRAVKTLRVVLGLHPNAAGVIVNRHLEEGLIWPI